MMRNRSVQHLVAWCIAVAVIPGVWIAGCSSTYDSDRRASDEPTAGGSSDPAATAADPASVSAGVQRGKQLFTSQGCMGCHTVNGQGGNVGPDLSNEGNSGYSRQWLQTQIRDPKSHDSQTAMPAFNNLSDQQVNDLVDYLKSLKTGQGQGAERGARPAQQAAAERVAPAKGASAVTAGGKLWGQTCGRCHNLRPPSEYSDAEWAVAVHHMRIRVPLTGQEQQEILEFLQASN